MSDNFFFEPDPESPVGLPFMIIDPDTGRETETVIATDGFRVKAVAGDITELPGVSFYVHGEDRVVFGFLTGVADIEAVNDGMVVETEAIFPRLMSRWEAPLSVKNYKQEQKRALDTGRFIVASGLYQQ